MIENVDKHRNQFEFVSVLRRYETEIALGLLVVFYLFVANYFSWSQAMQYPFLTNSGGSDPYFNYYIIQYILTYHTQLLHEIFLHYPIGSGNPRPPFFHWMIVFVATILSPIFGSAFKVAYYAFEEFDAVFGALLIIPVYLMAKEIFGKKAGIIAAFLYALMPGNLSAGILSDGRMHTPELFFAFLTIYFFEKALITSKKSLFLQNMLDFKSYIPSIINFYKRNRKATIYALLSGASIGGLMLSWQGYAYIEVILLIYIVVQAVINLLTRRPTGYLTYLTSIAMALGFLMGFYYYYGDGELYGWFIPEIQLAVLGIAFLLLINIIGRKPWIITVPLTIVVSLAGFFVLFKIEPTVMHTLISGAGYFIKSRVYTTIAEAAPLPLGEYINSFGVAQFIIGMSGIVYVIYKYVKEKSDALMFILVFAVVSIFMSFEAARFNITAAPAYGILGGGLLVYFIDMAKLTEVRKRNVGSTSFSKTVKGNINWVHAAFAVILVLVLVIPSGIGVVNAAIPENNANIINSKIQSELPAFMRSNNTTGQYFGSSGFFIDNSSQPLAQSFSWLSTQDTNVPIGERPAYVSWWDYGFQEVFQGQHPTVADDFQQGYVPAGQILLSQNQSQIVSILIALLVKGYYTNYKSFSLINSTLSPYLGQSGISTVYKAYFDPNSFLNTVISNSSIYGNFIKSPTSDNLYYGFLKGYLASHYSLNILNSAYLALEDATGYNVKYVQIDHSLFPFSGVNPGIFYAPAYLTDQVSYSYQGEIVPYSFYQIYASTDEGTFPLNQTPSTATITGLNITYTPAFYNTSIYRFFIGYPPSAVGQTNGIPGISYGAGQYEIMPAWNMSNFELVYLGVPYNPYNNTSAHPNAWKIVPIQQAYTLVSEGKGRAQLLPPISEIGSAADPIVAYYPGATITGKVTTYDGRGVGGIYVTIYDQYGIPHEMVLTNSSGYFSLVGLPGNDTVVISTGTLDHLTLVGSNVISYWHVHITNAQAERITTTFNSTTGLPDYYFFHNFQLKNTTISGSVEFSYPLNSSTSKSVPINNGTIILYNSTYNYTAKFPILNGGYSTGPIPPYDYTASVLANGTLYKDVQILNTTVGSSVVYDISVKYNQIRADVTVGGKPVKSMVVYAEGASGSYTSNFVNGTYIVYVPEGNYTVYARSYNTATRQYYVNFTGWGSVYNITMAAQPAVMVYGSASNISRITFYMDSQVNNATYTVNVSNGKFSVVIPVGVYTIYGSGKGTAYMRTIEITENTQLNVSGSPAYSVSLDSYVGEKAVSSGYYSIVGQNGYLGYPYSSNSTVHFRLPVGIYRIYSTATIAGLSYAGKLVINLKSNYSNTVELSNASISTIALYNNKISNSFNVTDAVHSGIVLLYSGNVLIEVFPVEYSGYSNVVYPLSTYSPVATVISPYYLEENISLNAKPITLGMKPVTIEASFELYNKSLKPEFNGYIDLYGLYNYNLTMVSGKAYGYIMPGIYYLSIWNGTNILIYNDTAITPSSSNLIDVGIYANFTSDISGVRLLTKTGSQLSFGPVPIGNYIVYYAKGSKVSVNEIAITNNTVYSNISLANGYYLNVTNSLNVSGNYLVKGSYFVIPGNGSFVLPAGNYYISFNSRFSNSTGSFYVYGNASLYLNRNTNLSVNVSMKEIFANTTILTNSPYSYVYVLSNGSTYASGRANSTGVASFMLPTRGFTVYSISTNHKMAAFNYLNINPFETSVVFNSSLSNSYPVYIYTALNGEPTYLNVSISLGSSELIVNSSVNYIYLPTGNYTFGSSISTTRHFPTENVTISYATSGTYYVNGLTYINLNLVEQKVYSFSTSLVSKVKTFGYTVVNDTVLYKPINYNITILNTGNTIVNITLQNGNTSLYAMAFNVSKLELIPGESANVSVNVTPKAIISSGLVNIPVNLNYTLGNTTKYIQAYFPTIYTYTVSSLPSEVNGTNVEVPLVINNTGNANITVNLSISNSYIQSLRSLNYNITYPSYVSVSAFGSKIVNITLIPTSTTPAPFVSFYMSVSYNNIHKSIELNATYPQLSKVSVVANGTGIISNYHGNPYLSLTIGLILIAITVVVGLALSAYRGRKK
ncbi:TVG1271204 [Thermoplasma volcanium GSS1]|uniref:dolichyl-phosphooligosaccharide-protein glycotransferase n=1 Tax=Thermoplasma volcanium (strain ATCC 51530 / DSM 4299 / JCM 9571 / NBRC 15438 / GSS1) TaxID=273116 RepID=Q979C6_THEVO|nr:glycosyltransferase family 39 protein [Thermoplasma volcanium]BAB60377.1 TVG1271204 [Thermoplasma volcanium GSS1]